MFELWTGETQGLFINPLLRTFTNSLVQKVVDYNSYLKVH